MCAKLNQVHCDNSEKWVTKLYTMCMTPRLMQQKQHRYRCLEISDPPRDGGGRIGAGDRLRAGHVVLRPVPGGRPSQGEDAWRTYVTIISELITELFWNFISVIAILYEIWLFFLFGHLRWHFKTFSNVIADSYLFSVHDLKNGSLKFRNFT